MGGDDSQDQGAGAEDASLLARLGRRLNLAPPFHLLTTAWLPVALILASGLASAAQIGFEGTEAQFLVAQDLPAFVLLLAVAATLGWAPRAWLARLAPGPAARRWWGPVALAVAVILVGALGAPLAFHGYNLTLDEYLANFDARIFARGLAMAPIDPRWRPYVHALQPTYMLPLPGADRWVSGYLPVNASLRALGSQLGLEDWVNPVLGGFSIVAVYAIARRLWPQRPGLALGAAALLGSSAQVIVTGLTAYAMPAHLAFNLAWLWLYLRGGKLGHAGALGVGFFASGIHQLPFHPLFVAPFVLDLWLTRRWKLAIVYTLAYAAICGFWVEYWRIEMAVLGLPAQASGALGGSYFLQKIALITQLKASSLPAMAASLIRLATWQSPLTIPLLLVGSVAAWRERGVLRALLLGVVLTLAAMAILEPSQTHGWGYRYLHGLLGSIVLIAVWTWARLTDGLPQAARTAAKGGFALAIVAGLALLAPLRLWQAASFVAPYVAADAKVRAAPEPVVIVDNETPYFDAGVVVRNEPFLAAGPKVMQLSVVSPDQLRALCAAGPVGLLDGGEVAALGATDIVVDLPPNAALAAKRGLMARLKCGTPVR